jgi:hypothetical protein
MPATKRGNVVQTFVIAGDEYMGSGPTMEEFRGTFRGLLVLLCARAMVCNADGTDESGIRQLPTDKLETYFEDANGDGQPYYTVWCVEQHRAVLGVD